VDDTQYLMLSATYPTSTIEVIAMPKLAIQEDMLSGKTIQERLSNAKRLGLSGVEFWADGLDVRLPDIVTALQETGLAVSGINLGLSDGYLSPDLETRETAIGRMREAMATAIDLEADYVSFVPHYGKSNMPDLTPYSSPADLQKEMMIWLLRTVSDLAYAMGTMLVMQPVNHYESSFMTRMDQAKFFRKKIKDHPDVKIAPNLFHMAMEEDDLMVSLQQYQDDIGVIYLADSNRRLPGQGFLPWDTIGNTLKAMEYDDWLVLECGQPGQNHDNAFHYYDTFGDCYDVLQSCL
jgi:sugar phosphate isomerase/epimerase